jgi:hypothetical protein
MYEMLVIAAEVMKMVQHSLGNGFQQLIQTGLLDEFEMNKRTLIEVVWQFASDFGLDAFEFILCGFVALSKSPVLCCGKNIVLHINELIPVISDTILLISIEEWQNKC